MYLLLLINNYAKNEIINYIIISDIILKQIIIVFSLLYYFAPFTDEWIIKISLLSVVRTIMKEVLIKFLRTLKFNNLDGLTDINISS